MVQHTLPNKPFSHNDKLVLADLYETHFSDYRDHCSPQVVDFIREIRTIAGLGFTAVLADEGYLFPYQSYLNDFIHGNLGDFRDDSGHASLWAQRMAEMIEISLGSFRRLGYPPYYNDFISAIEKHLKNIRIGAAGKTDKAKRLFDALPCKPQRCY